MLRTNARFRHAYLPKFKHCLFEQAQQPGMSQAPLRGVALGRKNFLFMGSNAGGERAAAFYRLVETAKLYGLDPEVYLREVFTRIADLPISRIDELLPWNIGLRPVARGGRRRAAADAATCTAAGTTRQAQ